MLGEVEAVLVALDPEGLGQVGGTAGELDVGATSAPLPGGAVALDDLARAQQHR